MTIIFARSAGSVLVTVNGILGDAELVNSALIEVLSNDVWITTAKNQYVVNPTVDTITINGASFSGTAAQLQTKLQTEVYQAAAGSSKTELQRVIAAMGGSIIAETAGMTIKTAVTATALTSGAVRYEPMIVNESKTATGVRLNIGTSGVYTANNFNGAAIFRYNAGTLTQIAISADTPNIWASAIGYIDLPFVTPVALNEGELIIVGFLYSSSAQTTAPAPRAAATLGATATAAYPMANSAKLVATQSAQTALPASVAMSALSPSSTTYWSAIY